MIAPFQTPNSLCFFYQRPHKTFCPHDSSKTPATKPIFLWLLLKAYAAVRSYIYAVWLTNLCLRKLQIACTWSMYKWELIFAVSLSTLDLYINIFYRITKLHANFIDLINHALQVTRIMSNVKKHLKSMSIKQNHNRR